MILKILKHLVRFSNKTPQLKMNRKIISQVNIRRKKSSTLIPLTFVTLHLNYHDRGWQMLTKLKLKVFFNNFS